MLAKNVVGSEAAEIDGLVEISLDSLSSVSAAGGAGVGAAVVRGVN